MSKEAFISELSAKLDRLSDDDRKDYLEFFSELIDDKIEEEGKSETDALEAMDSVCSIADEIIRQVPVEPDENARFPYGLDGVPLSDDELAAAFAKPAVQGSSAPTFSTSPTAKKRSSPQSSRTPTMASTTTSSPHCASRKQVSV